MSIEIESDPSTAQIREAFWHMDMSESFPDTLKTVTGWTEYMMGSHLHYFPIIIYSHGHSVAVIWLTDYDAELATCQIHFACSKRIDAPVAVARATSRALGELMRKGDIEVLLGVLNLDNLSGIRAARFFGMKEFATAGQKIYMSKTA